MVTCKVNKSNTICLLGDRLPYKSEIIVKFNFGNIQILEGKTTASTMCLIVCNGNVTSQI